MDDMIQQVVEEIKSYAGWQRAGRQVRKGERAALVNTDGVAMFRKSQTDLKAAIPNKPSALMKHLNLHKPSPWPDPSAKRDYERQMGELDGTNQRDRAWPPKVKPFNAFPGYKVASDTELWQDERKGMQGPLQKMNEGLNAEGQTSVKWGAK